MPVAAVLPETDTVAYAPSEFAVAGGNAETGTTAVDRVMTVVLITKSVEMSSKMIIVHLIIDSWSYY
jgi:hypothetical protein